MGAALFLISMTSLQPSTHATFINFIRLVAVLSSLLFFVFSVLFSDSTNQEMQFTSVMAAVSGVSLWLPYLIVLWLDVRHWVSLFSICVAQGLWMFMLIWNGLGALGMYQIWHYYDMVLHFTYPIIGGLWLSIMISGWLHKHNRFSLRSVQRITVVLVASLILLWEGFEALSDAEFGTRMFGQAGEVHDTMYDILAGFSSLFFIYLLIKQLHKALKLDSV